MSQIEAPPTRGLSMLCAARTQEEKKMLSEVFWAWLWETPDLRRCSNSTLIAAAVQHTIEERTIEMDKGGGGTT